MRKIIETASNLTRNISRSLKKVEPSTPPVVKREKKYTVVIPAYNCEPYIDKAIDSVVNQPCFDRLIDIVVVNDGSTDATLEKLNAWRTKYPEKIVVIDKPNGGESSARNAALEVVEAEWIAFLDADDWFAPQFFNVIEKHLNWFSTSCLSIIIPTLCTFNEADKSYNRSHHLNFRATNKSVVKSISKMDDHFVMAVHGLFKADIIKKYNLRFDERVAPVFPDANFSNRFMSYAIGTEVLFSNKATYFYRKRASADSMMDKSAGDIKVLTDVVEFGYLDLLRDVRKRLGYTPGWLKRAVWYSHLGTMRTVIARKFEHIPEEEKTRYLKSIAEMIGFFEGDFDIGMGAISGHVADEIFLRSRVSGDDGFFKARVARYDIAGNTIEIWVGHIRPEIELKLLHEERELLPAQRKEWTNYLFSDLYSKNIRVTFDISEVKDGEPLILLVDGKPCPIANSGLDGVELFPKTKLRKFRNEKTVNERALGRPDRLKRIKVLADDYRTKYRGSWVVMDRDTHASDNGEHFFRHLMHAHPEMKKHFVLAETSPDWERLKQEGFDLLPFASDEHFAAVTHCEALISSQLDEYVFNMAHPRVFGDHTTKRKNVFLQHGVTMNDVSNWFNGKAHLSLIIAATNLEYEELTLQGGRYRFLPGEVALTGFARYDELHRISSANAAPKKIIVSPSWRKNIIGAAAKWGNERSYSENFANTDYFHALNNLMSSAEMRDLKERHGFELVYIPHPNTDSYMDLFDTSIIDRIVSHANSGFQREMAGAAALITDYSSTNFDAAYAGVPVLYYQFDKEDFFRDHAWRPGHFSYDAHGFGPVLEDEASVIAALDDIGAGRHDADGYYRGRAEAAFTYRDDQNCERIYEAIKALTA